MKWLLVFAIACSSSPPREPVAKPLPYIALPGATMIGAGASTREVEHPFTLEVMLLEVIGNVDVEVTARARNLTAAMRAAAREYKGVTVGSSQKQLLDLRRMFNCESEAPKCMATITRSLPADRMIWGTLEGDRVKLHLITAADEVVINIVNEGRPLDEVGLKTIASDAIHALISRPP